MRRPDWCPGDVWETAAINLVGRAHTETSDQVWVARAILTERERCGKYATDQAEREPYGHCKATAYLIADNIMGGK